MNISKVGVVGSGIMGSGIAEVAMISGFEVVLRSRRQESAVSMVGAIERSLAKRVERQKMTAEDARDALARLLATTDIDELGDCDLVIESVVEDLEVKRHLFEHLDRIVKPHAILATNTSTLPVVDMAMATKRPESVCGIHFFNPAVAMTLVEVVRPLTASEDTIQAALNFAKVCGKEPVLVKDEAGFVVNALLFPYLNNAVRLYERGVATAVEIDKSMKLGCGFPMGPLALLDLVGLDTSIAILDALYKEFGDPGSLAAPTLRRMVAAGHLGKKSRHGFYDYH